MALRDRQQRLEFRSLLGMLRTRMDGAARPDTDVNAESARGISPRASHRTGLDTLASSGSCHRAKAAAFH